MTDAERAAEKAVQKRDAIAEEYRERRESLTAEVRQALTILALKLPAGQDFLADLRAP